MKTNHVGAQISEKGGFWNRVAICRKIGVYSNFVQRAVSHSLGAL